MSLPSRYASAHGERDGQGESRKSTAHIFQLAPAELNYGWTFPIWLEDGGKAGRLEAEKPKDPHHPGANCVLSAHFEGGAGKHRKSAASSRSPTSPTSSSRCRIGRPVIREMKEVDAGVIMVDHWVAAEYAAFCKQFVADPVRELASLLAIRPFAAGVSPARRHCR